MDRLLLAVSLLLAFLLNANSARVTNDCGHFLSTGVKNCIPYNFTLPDKTIVTCNVSCVIQDIQNITICKMELFKQNVSHILRALPVSTEKLLIIYDNSWYGYLPQQPSAVDLTLLSRLKNLTFLHMTPRIRANTQLYPLTFNITSLQELSKLTRLDIKMPIKDSNTSGYSLKDVVRALPNLRHLDFSYTRGLGYRSFCEILAAVNRSKIERLCFRQFQLAGESNAARKLDVFSSGDMEPFPHLLELDISSNFFTRISPGITNKMPKLQRLDFSGNMILDSHNIAFLTEVILHPSLVTLNASFQGFALHDSSLSGQSFQNTNISQSQKNMLFMSEVAYGTQCVNSVSEKNNFSTILNSSVLTCKFVRCLVPLEYEELQCENNTFFPPLKQLLNSSCMMNIMFPLGKNLSEIHFSHIHWEQAEVVSLDVHGHLCFSNNTLDILDISGNKDWSIVSGIPKNLHGDSSGPGIIGFNNISHLNASYNGFDIDIDDLTKNFQDDQFQRLKSLDLSGNNLKMDNPETELCLKMPRLQYVTLKEAGLTRVPKNLFRNCTYLEKICLGFATSEFNESLTHQLLSDFDELELAGTSKIKSIDLSHNSIPFLAKEFTDKLSRYKPLTIDLSDNPLTCGCDNITQSQTFIKWMLNSRGSITFVNFKDYSCIGPNNEKVFLKDAQSVYYECESKVSKYVLYASSIFCFILAAILICLFCYNYRHRIRHRFHSIFYLLCYNERREGPKQYHKIHIYISAAQANHDWAKKVLEKTLNDKFGYTTYLLPLDKRKDINVLAHIENQMKISRRIILVMSEESLQDPICKWEMDKALEQIKENEKKEIDLTVIKFGKISADIMFRSGGSTYQILDGYPYVEWTKPGFFKLLEENLRLINPAKIRMPGGQADREEVKQRMLNEIAQDEEVTVADLPEEAKVHWESGLKATESALKIDQDIELLQKTLEGKDKDLSDAMYGPAPVHSLKAHLTEEHLKVINEKVEMHARDKITYFIDILKEAKRDEEKKGSNEARKIRELMRRPPVTEQGCMNEQVHDDRQRLL